MGGGFVLIFVIFSFLSEAVLGEQNNENPHKKSKYQVQPFHHMEKHIPRDSFIQRGRSSGSTSHEVFIAIHQNNIPELKQSVLDRATPGHPLYQQWMNFGEVGNMVKNEEAYKAVVDWLEAYEVKITWTSPYEEYVKATAPISTWETMLSTHFYEFEDLSHAVGASSKGRLFHRALEYWIPAELTKSIDAIFHTVQTPPRFKPKYRKRIASAPPESIYPFVDKPHKTHLRVESIRALEEQGGSVKAQEIGESVTVSFLDETYKVQSNIGSSKLNQSVFETSNEYFNPSDLTTFQEKYSLTVQSAISIGNHTISTCTATKDCTEGNLDIQYIMGMAQKTGSIFWWISDTSDPFVAWIEEVVADPYPPQVNSISWGESETGISSTIVSQWENEAAKLAGRGVTITVSSGDDGAPGSNGNNVCLCSLNNGYNPSFPATSAWVTAVGATMGPETGSPEVVCSSSTNGVITSGGGFSIFVDTPSYQTSAVNYYLNEAQTSSSPPTTGYNTKGRGYPDVALIGVNYQIIVNGLTETVYGTSCSSPVFASFVSLVNAARLKDNKTAIGFINPTLYQVGYNNTIGLPNIYNATFNDVTSGNNLCCASGSLPQCCSSGFTALKGWDPTTGWGSIDYPDLAEIFSVPSPTPSFSPSPVPTIFNSPAPTVAPSLYQTTATSASPSDAPTYSPSDSPTLASSDSPTIFISYAPTIAPTDSPSAVPTNGPTAPSSVSAIPTATPTATRTQAPSAAISVVPTLVPTLFPSASPTTFTPPPSVFPTAVPTQAPTSATLPTLQFNSNITLTGVTSTTLSSSDQLAVINATATSMNIALSSVTYVTSVNSAVHTAKFASKNIQGLINVHLSGNTIIAITQTSQLVQTGTNATLLYQSLSASLTAAVEVTGSFTKTLQAASKFYGATGTASATATKVTSSSPVVASPSSSSSSSSNSLSGGDIAGIVIGSVVGFALLVFVLYYLFNVFRPSIPEEKEQLRSKRDDIGITL